MDIRDNLLITGVGSLSHQTPEKAIEYSLAHDIPFLPQLTAIDGNMIEQARILSYKLLPQFIEKTKGRTVKIQLVGPTSSTLSLKTIKDNINCLSYFFEKERTLFFIDEPRLAPTPQLKELLIYAKTKFNKIGLHCCANNISAIVVNELPLDIFSYDYTLNPNLHQELNEELEICLGIIPTNNSKSIPVLKFAPKYLTATCGLEGCTIDQEVMLEKLKALRHSLV